MKVKQIAQPNDATLTQPHNLTQMTLVRTDTSTVVRTETTGSLGRQNINQPWIRKQQVKLTK
jgi:hypothetical protein